MTIFPTQLLYFACIFAIIVAEPAFSAESFPSDALPGVSVGGNLPSGYEPSGIVWHTRLKKLFVVGDDGDVSSMNADGTGVVSWFPGGDLEGITIASHQNNFVYLGIENPDSIREFNITTGQVTRTFNLTTWMTGDGNAGLEALTFVPDVCDPEGGLFYAGLQATGQIFVFRLPIRSSSTATTVTPIRTIPALNGVSDISGMHYEVSQQVLYAIYDSTDLLRAMDADGTLIREWNLPGINQEGVTLKGLDFYIAQDSGGVLMFSPFAVFCQPDLNADGKTNLLDLTSLATYWQNDYLLDIFDLAAIADNWLENYHQ